MTRRRQDAATPEDTPSRVSPSAPDFVSPSYQAWTEATKDPQFRADVKAGLTDAKAGRTKPWSEVRKRIR